MIRRIGLVFSVLALVATVFACKKSESEGAGDVVWPERVKTGESDATAANKIGVYGEGGGKTITVDLERPHQAGEGAVWACWSRPPNDYVLGRAVCSSDPSRTLELTAANVDKKCGTSTDFGILKATAPLSLADCAAYDIFAYEFNPPLVLSISE